MFVMLSVGPISGVYVKNKAKIYYFNSYRNVMGASIYGTLELSTDGKLNGEITKPASALS